MFHKWLRVVQNDLPLVDSIISKRSYVLMHGIYEYPDPIDLVNLTRIFDLAKQITQNFSLKDIAFLEFPVVTPYLAAHKELREYLISYAAENIEEYYTEQHESLYPEIDPYGHGIYEELTDATYYGVKIFFKDNNFESERNILEQIFVNHIDRIIPFDQFRGTIGGFQGAKGPVGIIEPE